MNTSAVHKKQYLQLDTLTPSQELAQRLPPELAFRYHALPVAERAGRITVAMADPDDVTARMAVSSALGNMPYLVRGDLGAIDTLLKEIWPERSQPDLRFLVYDGDLQGEDCEGHHTTSEVWEYATALGKLSNAGLERVRGAEGAKRTLAVITDEVARTGCDLVVMGEVERSKPRRLFPGRVGRRAIERFPTSLCVVRNPKWPLTKVLVVVRCNETNDSSIDWSTRLAGHGGVAVTILVITPFLPVVYRDSYLESLMAPDTATGLWLRQIGQRLEQWHIPGAISIRQGEPPWQIRQEISNEDYDLVIIAADTANGVGHRLWGEEIVVPLLQWADRPVLVARGGPDDSQRKQWA